MKSQKRTDNSRPLHISQLSMRRDFENDEYDWWVDRGVEVLFHHRCKDLLWYSWYCPLFEGRFPLRPEICNEINNDLYNANNFSNRVAYSLVFDYKRRKVYRFRMSGFILLTTNENWDVELLLRWVGTALTISKFGSEFTIRTNDSITRSQPHTSKIFNFVNVAI